MAEYVDREHYIPLRLSDLVDLLCTQKDLSAHDRHEFRQFCRLVAATFHFEYHERLRKLKDDYAPFDPDRVTATLAKLLPEVKETHQDRVFDAFVSLMERANYKRLTKDDIKKALEGSSEWGLDMDVDFDAFERLEIFIRGDSVGKRYLRRWYRPWLLEEIKVPVYRRFVLMVKARQHKRLGPEIDTDDIYVKMFKDIPKMDIEMLLPGARVKMPGLSRLKMSGSLLTGLGLVAWKLLTEFAELLGRVVAGGLSMALYAPVALVLGYGYKQYYGYNVAKTTYSYQLTRSLYYQNLDNNQGVFYHVIDEAEEQECREVILAYFCLWRSAPAAGWNSADLDDYVEMELERLANLKVDFEIGDALEKLDRLGLVEKTGDRYRAKPLRAAQEKLDYLWDNYFQYNNAPAAQATVS
jgi:hypothetical protein